MSEQMSPAHEGWARGPGRPASNCRDCRLADLTVPCKRDDVRRLVRYEERDGGLYVVPYDTDPAPVKPYREHVVVGYGPVPCPIMLIGEAPGFHEDREGLPFRPSAPAGRVLHRVAADVGLFLKLDDDQWTLPSAHNPFAYVTNALKCRPLDNKIDRFPDALEVCRSTYLFEEIEVVQPKVVVCLGKVAAQPWFGTTSALAFRQIGERLYVHAPHPSYIARGNHDAEAKLREALTVAKEVGYAHE